MTKIELAMTDIDKVDFIYNSPFQLTVHWENVKFEFLIRLKVNSNKLYCFGNGAYNSEKMSLPVFQRHSWIEDIDESIIIYNDPTLYLGKINLGWGQGTQERFYIEDLSLILKKIIRKLEVKKSHVTFYGSSAGGFLSLYLAGLIRGTKALVNNPQVFVPKYYQTHVNKMYLASYPGLDRTIIESKYKERLEIIAFYASIEYVPEICYLQNLSWSNDVKNQLLPFISGLNLIKEFFDEKKIRFEFYQNLEQGHNPLSKEETLNYLKQF
ncbi:glycosyl transferase family 2 [Rummeliibacillus sp. JY-2-4R]